MGLQEFFNSLPAEGEASKQRVKLIDDHFPECQGEEHSVSAHSRGVVTGAEFIFRYIFSPIHIEEDGSVKSAAFSDVEDKGFSCDRSISESPHHDIHERGIAQVEKHNRKNPDSPHRSYLGTIHSLCDSIRSIKYESGPRAFAVYDTAKADNCDHVDVCQTLSESKAVRKLARKRLRDAFTKVPIR